MATLLIILLGASLILSILALADFPAGSRLAFLCAALLILTLALGVVAFGVKLSPGVLLM